ncbi:sulfite exporter TauE/SafE family protein [Deinococcus peraridilitoris]|uniref:urease accessory protein UreH domain-containing protein n=1 Tax=Deinococcus peraridilitoris TaxID=432329 RepID=UPI0012FC2414|nr:sulfite exporter TauE/SafE family protein [Deinococcus peraridilitoris]
MPVTPHVQAQHHQDHFENRGEDPEDIPRFHLACFRAEQDLRAGHSRAGAAGPIVMFLLAKLIAYTLLGALLGALGSFLALTPLMQAALQFTVGVFMIGNALRLRNVHPVFQFS